MMHRAYLDHNATSPMRPEVLRAMQEVFLRVGNPSSVHAEGRAARALVEEARERVAGLVGARPDDVVFTSGGTEANATALRPGALAVPGGRAVCRLVVGATEHPSVTDGHGFCHEMVQHASVDGAGLLELDRLAAALDALGEPALVSVQFANGETGVLQSVADIAALVHDRGGVLHADAVQAAGRVPVDIAASGADAVTLSGHKLGGPMGVGALVCAPGRAGERLRLIAGGGQESGRRAGTENVAGIVGFGVAAEIAGRDIAAEPLRLRGLRDLAEREIRRIAPDAVVFGERAERLPNTVAFATAGLAAETALISLDLDGVAVSSGSACSSGRVGRSHVLAAMGIGRDLASGAIRLSFGWNSAQEDVMRFSRGFEKLVQRLYEGRHARAA